MSELGRPFIKKSDGIFFLKKKQKINVKKPHVNKNHQREIEIWFKQKTKPRKNYEWIAKTI